jgi:hypothetical protein
MLTPSASIFNSPVWTPVGVIVGVLAIAVAIFIAVRSRAKKSLDYQISQTSVASVSAEASDQIEILYAGQPARHVHLIEIMIENTGTLAITADDFERPLGITFGDGALPLTAGIARTIPKDLTPSVTITNEELVLDPLLLNRHDSVTLKTLVRDFEGPVSLHARIANIPHLTDAVTRDNRRKRRLAWLQPLAGVAASLILVFQIASALSPTPSLREFYYTWRGHASFCGRPKGLGPHGTALYVEAHSRTQLAIPIGELPRASGTC